MCVRVCSRAHCVRIEFKSRVLKLRLTERTIMANFCTATEKANSTLRLAKPTITT